MIARPARFSHMIVATTMALAALTLVGCSSGDPDPRAASASSPSGATAAEPGSGDSPSNTGELPHPGPHDYPVTIEAAGEDLLVNTETNCVPAPPGHPRQCQERLWRYDGTTWSTVSMPDGRPGYSGQWLDERIAVYPPWGTEPALVTQDGGDSWRETPFPPACLQKRHGCQLSATATALFITDSYLKHPVKLYRADPSLKSWRPVRIPAGADSFTFFGAGVVGVDTPNATQLWVSRDDGENWSRATLPCDNVFPYGEPNWSGVVAECGDGNQAELLHTSDLRSWQRLGTYRNRIGNASYPKYLSDEAAIVPGKHGLTLLTPSGSATVTLPEGSRFEYVVTRVGSIYYAVAHSGPRDPWSQEVIRSDDRGRTWTVLLASVPQP